MSDMEARTELYIRIANLEAERASLTTRLAQAEQALKSYTTFHNGSSWVTTTVGDMPRYESEDAAIEGSKTIGHPFEALSSIAALEAKLKQAEQEREALKMQMASDVNQISALEAQLEAATQVSARVVIEPCIECRQEYPQFSVLSRMVCPECRCKKALEAARGEVAGLNKRIVHWLGDLEAIEKGEPVKGDPVTTVNLVARSMARHIEREQLSATEGKTDAL